jgi:hypothetical protein
MEICTGIQLIVEQSASALYSSLTKYYLPDVCDKLVIDRSPSLYKYLCINWPWKHVKGLETNKLVERLFTPTLGHAISTPETNCGSCLEKAKQVFEQLKLDAQITVY